ncbi:hypothetical protein Tco_0642398 [Tanacetum coccineum]
MPDEELRELCDKHYNQLLPLMAKKVHQEKLQVVQTCLTYEESSRRNSQAKEKTHVSESESCDKKKRSKKRRKPSLSTTSRRSYPSQSPSVFSRMKHGEQSSPRQGIPSTTVFTRLGTRMQDERQVLEELKETQTAEKRSGEPRAKLSRVWFDKLPPESIDGYVILRKAFFGNFSQQNKYIKDPVEIHHIKQREGDSTEAFMERFKAESMHISGASECMRVSGFMHGITNPDLIKRLNDNIPKSVDEMMSMTTEFLRGEVVVANQSIKKAPSTWRHHEMSHKPSFDKRLDFKNRQKSGRRQDRFTPLIKTPKEILTIDTVKFKAPSLMSVPAENRNKNKFCEFHRDKGRITDECIHLKNK